MTSKPTGKPPSPAQASILAALKKLAGPNAAMISDHTGLAYSTVTANLRTLRSAGLVQRQRHPDGSMTWHLPAVGDDTENSQSTAETATDPHHRNRSPDADTHAAPAQSPVQNTQPETVVPRQRRAKGVLRAEVLAVLQNHPDRTFKVSQVHKHLPDASSGAIANALDRLVADGTAQQVTERPATYQAE